MFRSFRIEPFGWQAACSLHQHLNQLAHMSLPQTTTTCTYQEYPIVLFPAHMNRCRALHAHIDDINM
jgi:hypothetical protein